MLEEDLSRGQEAHAARGAREELTTELVLQAPDLPAHRGLRDAQAARSAPDVPFLGDRDEVTDLRQAHVRSPIVPLAPRLRKRFARQINKVLDLARRSRHDGVMAIEIHGTRAVERLRRAGRAAAETLAYVGARIQPGVTTAQIDAWVREDTARRGGRPSQLGYHGFPAAVCTSRNEVVCHGIPRPDVVLESGDIVNVDVTTELDGYHGDTSATFVVGEASPEAQHVVDVARRCRDAGVAVVREGGRFGDIGAAIEEVAKREGLSIVREYGGHGIGRQMHQSPHVHHTGVRGTGPRFRAGMAFTIEPMVNLGTEDVRRLPDGWTVVTADGRLSAQFEHTVLVTPGGCEVLTAL